MEENRTKAYSFLLSAAMLDLKWDLVQFWNGLSLWRPWRLLRQSRHVQRAAHRAVAFHNLAFFVAHDFDGFREELFWMDIAKFKSRFPEQYRDYERAFERKLLGEELFLVTAGLIAATSAHSV